MADIETTKPFTLKAAFLFIDGVGYFAKVTEMTLPKLVEKTEDFRAAEMPGAISLGLGLEKLEIEFKLAELQAEIMSLFGVSGQEEKQISIRGSQESGDQQRSLAISCRGNFAEIDPGSYKPGDKTEMSVKAVLSYYRFSSAGIVIHEIDMINSKMLIGGNDILAERRAALGLP